ncbi:ATP synthase I-like protein [Haematococcus lacustris]
MLLPHRLLGSVPCQPLHRRSRQPASKLCAQTTNSDNNVPAEPSVDISAPRDVALPRTGYFAIADTKQEVYGKAGEKFDPTKRGGRYQPEFIWNTEWQKTLEREESLQRRYEAAQAQGAEQGPAGPQPGAVSFSRLAQLNSMDVDLSATLARKPAKKQPQTVTMRSGPAAKPVQQPAKPARQVAVPLPRNDIKRLVRSNRVVKQMMVVSVSSEKPEDLAMRAVIAAREAQAYEAEKQGQRAWAAALAAVGAAAVYVSYSREVCVSYVVGALGGLLYLRLLGRSVDSYGGQGAATAATGVVGNQRLLIPIILALSYNRWNALYADESGITLNFLAMLVGFLTYKVAVVARQGKQVFDEMAIRPKEN